MGSSSSILAPLQVFLGFLKFAGESDVAENMALRLISHLTHRF